MYAVEFQTQITNGEIQLPDEWKGKLLGSVRVTVLTETEPAIAENQNGFDFREKAKESAAERGLRMLREASLDQDRLAAGWAAAMREMGVTAEPVGAEKLQQMMIAEAVNPEENQFSQGIIAMREE